VNGAGYGWFIDAAPWEDGEFTRWTSPTEGHAAAGSAIAGQADLLTVVMHELGHVLGLAHRDDSMSVMSDTLELGTRRPPTAREAAIADFLFATWHSRRRR
jgi:hypothetical protein